MANFFDQFDGANSGAAVDQRSRDLAIRTIYGEAGDQPDIGKAAVAAVINNRATSGKYGGKDVAGVVTAPNQFEPWQRPDARQRMMALTPESPDYQKIAAIFDGVIKGDIQDPTNGATHFFSPGAQAALGRKPPSWAQGEGQQIGGHMFFAPDEKRPAKASPASPQAGNFFDQFDEQPQRTAPQIVPGQDGQPTRVVMDMSAPTVAQRSEMGPGPENAGALQQALTQTATSKTKGEPTSDAYKVTMDFLNQGSAAGQRTTPNISAHQPNLISTKVFENDAGQLLYENQAGDLVPTDSNKHVAMRDPADGVIKVFARTPDTDEGVLSSAGRLMGTGLAAGAPTARPAIPLPQMVKTPAPSVETIKEASKAGYQAAGELGVKIDPKGLNSLADDIHSALREVGYRIPTAPKTFGAIEELRLPKGQQAAEFADIDAARRVLQKAGMDPSEKDAVRIATKAIDEYLAAIPDHHVISGDAARLGEIATEARGNYAAAKRAERVGEASQKAIRQAEKAGSGSNIDNTTRQQIDRILNNPKQLRGFSKEEVQQMRDIVKGTRVGNNARLLGKLAPTGVVSGALSVGAGFGAGGGAGAVLFPAIGLVAKRLGDAITAKQLAKLDELVRSNSPLARAAESSSAKWTKSSEDLVKNPTTPKIAAFLLLTRNLSNTLKLTGINATPDELFKSLQIGGVSRAENDQQRSPWLPSQ